MSQILPSAFSPELCHSLIAGIFELSTGIYTLSEVSTSPAALPMAAFILGWGGLSVHCQSLPFLNRCVNSLLPYFLGKLLQGLLAALLTAIFMPFLLSTVPTTTVPIHTIFLGSPPMKLIQQELVALWCLSGAYFFFHQKKGLEKPRHLHYNRNNH